MIELATDEAASFVLIAVDLYDGTWKDQADNSPLASSVDCRGRGSVR